MDSETIMEPKRKTLYQQFMMRELRKQKEKNPGLSQEEHLKLTIKAWKERNNDYNNYIDKHITIHTTGL
jgi:hypothetical protein